MWGHVTNVTPIPDVIHEFMSRPSSCRMRLCSPAVRSRTSAGDTIWPRGYNLSRSWLLGCPSTTPVCSVIAAGVSPYNILTTCRPCLRPPVSLCTAVHQCSPMYNTHEQHWYSQFVSNSCAGQTWRATVTSWVQVTCENIFVEEKNWFLDELWIDCEWLG